MSKTKDKVIEALNNPYYELDQIYYNMGLTSPNYPMPAIRLYVDICECWDKTVCIIDIEWNEIVYGVYEGDFN